MARSVRVVCYAVNGGGVGHLTRLIALARWIRRYAAHAGHRAEIVFLTSSEADGALFDERIASFKVPSKTAAHLGGLDKVSYLALAKQWIWHSIALLRPDVFVVDTFPRGSFNELLGCLDLCRKRVFVYRPVKPELAARPEFQSMLPLYDLILVPDDHTDVMVPPVCAPRVRRVGAMAIREPAEMATREEARARLAIPEDAFVVHASAGGGGDPGAEADLRAIYAALEPDPSVHLVVAAGPLFRGAPLFGPRTRFLTQLGGSEIVRAADVAISAAGYNSFTELMIAGVPTVFVPQPKVADEQLLRAERAKAAGAAAVLSRPLDPAAVTAAIEPFRASATRAQAGLAARTLVRPGGAKRAAQEVLRLALGASVIDAAAAAIDDATIEASRALQVDEEVFIEWMRLLDPGPADLPGLDPGGASAAARRVVRAITERRAPIATATRALAAFLRRVETGTVEERAHATLILLDALDPFADWAGAHAVLRLAPLDGLGPVVAAEDIARKLALTKNSGGDLYRSIERLVRAQESESGVDLREEPEEQVEGAP